jgi:DnaJ-class molecular chaperone
LGVERNAKKSEVKKAFYRLARKYHPDLNNSATAQTNMQTINLADKQFKLEFCATT